MQQYQKATPTATNASVPRAPIRTTGRNLKRLLHGKSARVRAQAGAKLVRGEFAYEAPTVPQAARIVGTSAQRIHAALGHQPKPPTDAEIDRLVAKLGAERVMAALDRWTEPRFAFAAE
jgi:hypothetical protein